MAELVQVTLESGESRLMCWVDGDRKIRAGSVITLKDSDEPSRQWTVRAVGAPRDSKTIRTDWNVGGVNSRRQ